MKRGPKLTDEQTKEVVKSYVEKGFYATAPLAESYGIRPKSVSGLARKAGHLNNPRPTRVIKKYTARDRRWLIAIQRGAVSI